MGNISNNTVMA